MIAGGRLVKDDAVHGGWGRVQEAHVRSIEISKKNELSIQLGPGRSFIGPSLQVLALTLALALAEALAASELLAKKLILFSA